MTEEINNNVEKITNGLIKYLEFLKKFKTVNHDVVISNEQNNNSHSNFFYDFREFNLEY